MPRPLCLSLLVTGLLPRDDLAALSSLGLELAELLDLLLAAATAAVPLPRPPRERLRLESELDGRWWCRAARG